MGEIEHAGTSKTMPRLQTSEDSAGVVTGEILGEPTTKTETPPGADQETADKIANQRGMPPISRP